MILEGAGLAAVHYQGRMMDPREYLRRFGYDGHTDRQGVYWPEPPPLTLRAEQAVPVLPFVDRGLWIALCPCGLGSAQDPPVGGGFVFEQFPYIWCPRCENADLGGGWRLVAPVPLERRAIEAMLDRRPNIETRNWLPGESVADLVAENVAHGIEG